MPPCNIYSDDKPDVGFPAFHFQFWVGDFWTWNIYEFCVGKYSFEIRCCSSCGSASIDIFIDIEFITMKWHFGLRAKFISIFTIMFEFIILTISLAFYPPSPLLGFNHFKTNPNTDNSKITKRDKKCHFRRLLFTLEWVDQYQLWRLRGGWRRPSP